MYEGSMFGAGPHAFAVMGYIIAKTRAARVELNPKLLAAIIGSPESEIIKAIEYLCAPDPNSRSQDHEGRRLIREGQFQYFVTGWERYRAMRNEDARREQNRRAQAKHRLKRSKPAKGELAYVKAEREGASQEDLDRMTDPMI